jgi:hypothetical protein
VRVLIMFRRTVPAAAIAVPSAVVVLILVFLGFLYHRQRQRDRRASRVAFDFSTAQEPPSVPTLPSVPDLGGWNDPPVSSAFASSGPARDPFADPVLMSDNPTSAPRPPIAISYTREIRRVPSADPFADPPVVVFASKGEGPSRLSKSSSSAARDARSSVTFSNVRFSPFIRVY